MKSPALRYVRANSGLTFRPDASTVLWLPGQDDAYSATIRDRSGQGNHGTITGATWARLSSGLGLLDFDGTDDKVQKLNPTFVDDTAGTILIWVKMDAITAEYTLWSFTLDVAWGAACDEFTFDFRGDLNDQLRAALNVNGATTWLASSPNNTIVDTNFHMVTLKSNGSTVSLSVDAVSLTLTTTVGTNTGQWFASAPDADRITFGGLQRVSLVTDFDGRMGLIRVFNRALSASEETTIFNRERHLFGV